MAGIYGIAVSTGDSAASAPAPAVATETDDPLVTPSTPRGVPDDAPPQDFVVALAADDEKPQPKAPPVAVPADTAKPGGAAAPSPPARVQIVTPEDLMRERIQAEKDLLELPRHPLLVRDFPGHAGPVTSVAFTPDGTSVVSVSGWPTGDRTARVWEVATGKEIRRFDTAAMPKNSGTSGGREAPGEFFTVAITPDGKHAVTGATGGAVCVWDIATGKLVRQFDKHTATVYDAAVSSRGDVALTGGRDSIGRLWNFSTGEELLQLAGHRTWIRAVAISPDGKRALTGSYDKVMRLWDLERGEMVREFRSDQDWIWDIAFTPSGLMAACVSGTQVQWWDLETWQTRAGLHVRGCGKRHRGGHLPGWPLGDLRRLRRKGPFVGRRDGRVVGNVHGPSRLGLVSPVFARWAAGHLGRRRTLHGDRRNRGRHRLRPAALEGAPDRPTRGQAEVNGGERRLSWQKNGGRKMQEPTLCAGFRRLPVCHPLQPVANREATEIG